MSEKDKLKETLSALFDDEAGKQDQLELRRLVRSLDDNPELVATYQRYVLARAALKGEPVPARSPDFLGNVREALEKETMEDVVSGVSETTGGNKATSAAGLHWLKSLGRVAVAASVAVVAVYVVEYQASIAPSAGVAAMQTPAAEAVAGTTSSPSAIDVSGERNNRMLAPDVMTVSAGDHQPFDRPVDSPAKTSGCIISSLRADNSSLVWEKELPAGYVLCKQKNQSRECESVTSRIGCYLN